MTSTFGKVPNGEEKQEVETQSRQLAIGQISSEQYVQSVAHILNTPLPSTDAFERNIIAVTHDPSPEMMELVALARKSGISVALLSNMYMFEVIETKPWGRYDGFDRVVFSAEAQLTKRDPELFLRLISHFDGSPARTLFVDDVADHVHIAQRLGIQTIHADKTVFSTAAALADSIREKLPL